MTEASERSSESLARRVQAQLAANGRILSISWARDLSLKGLLLGCDEPVPLGTPCQLSLSLDDRAEHCVTGLAHVVRAEDGCLALELTNFTDSEDFRLIREAIRESDPGQQRKTRKVASDGAPVTVRQLG